MTAVLQLSNLSRASMQHRPVSRRQRAQRRGRRQHRALERACLAIAGRRPLQRPALRDQDSSRLRCSIAPSGNSSKGIGTACNRFCHPSSHSATEARRRSRALAAADTVPCSPRRETGWRHRGDRRSKGDARPRSRAAREKNNSVQLCLPITSAPLASKFADASEPRLAGPAPRQQGPGRGIVNDAAIAGEQAAMRAIGTMSPKA